MKKYFMVFTVLLAVFLTATKGFSAVDPNWRFVSHDKTMMACLRCDGNECQIVIVNLKDDARYNLAKSKILSEKQNGIREKIQTSWKLFKNDISDNVISDKDLLDQMWITYAPLTWSQDDRTIQFTAVDKGKDRKAIYHLIGDKVEVF